MKPICSRLHLRLFAGMNVRNIQQFRCYASSTSGGDANEKAKSQLDSHYSESPEYPTIIPPDSTRKHMYKTLERLKYERKLLAEQIKAMPTALEKINAMNPFERNWIGREKKWHRPWQDPLIRPRYAWRINMVPEVYDALPFYQFITKTHAVEKIGLPSFYDSIRINDGELKIFEQLLRSRIIQEKRRNDIKDNNVAVKNLIDHMVQAAVSLFGSKLNHLQSAQIDVDARASMFWVRGGFQSLYPEEEQLTNPKYDSHKRFDPARLVGDHIDKLGELAFCFREKFAVQLRSSLPLKQVYNMLNKGKEESFNAMENELNSHKIEPLIYVPNVLGYKHDKDYLFMDPGYIIGDPNVFSLFVGASIADMSKWLKNFEAEPEERDRAMQAAAISLCFSTLYPMTTQAMLMDENDNIEFYAYQLNTIAIMQAWDADQRPNNLIWRSGTMKLLERNEKGEIASINSEVIKIFLKFMHNAPVATENEENLRPFLKETKEEEQKFVADGVENVEQEIKQKPNRVAVSN